LISTILSEVEIFAEFIGENTFEIRAKIPEISPEKSVHEPLQDKRKRLSPVNCFFAFELTFVVITTI